MRHFKEYEEKVFSLINENDNYIIFNDGKPIRTHYNDDDVEINVDGYMDSYDICKRVRPEEEDKILSNSRFNNNILINKDIDLKIIYLNDDEDYLSFSFEIKRDIKVNITNIYLSYIRDTQVVSDYNLNDNAIVKVTNFTNYDSKVKEYTNYYLDDKANLEVNNLTINNNESFINSNVYLYCEKANAKINNSSINASSKNQVNKFDLYHLEKKTTSELIGYGVCLNASSTNMDTNGIIKNGASKTEIHQTSKGILLDLESSISASPLLQIDEFDCMASHGASVGAVDDSDIFYLMSRGLDRKTSEALIINGFFNPYLSRIDDEKVFNYIQKIIEDKLVK